MVAFALAVALMSCVQVKPGLPPASPRLPNIVFIMADDLGYGDLGCYNAESKIPTPHLDRFATQGMRFTDAHAPVAVCTPTRYGVLTGRYCWRTWLTSGVLWGFSPSLIKPDRLTVASLLKRHGYSTGCVGKWHLGLGSGKKTDYSQPLYPNPTTYGFDYFFGIPASLDMEPYVYIHNDRVLAQPTGRIGKSRARRKKDGGGFWRAGPIAPGFKHVEVLPVITEKAVAFIEERAKKAPGKPFFLYFPLTAPHMPWMPTKEFIGKSDAGYYGDFTAQVDWVVGQVLETLDRLNLSENTLVIFTSDNGAHWTQDDIKKWGHRANGALRGQKGDIHEGGHRVPFIARWPGKIWSGTISSQTICHTDLMATCAAIVGEDLPDDAAEDSYNILPAFFDARLQKPVREATVHQSGNGMLAIRQGKWKLAMRRGSGGFSRPKVVKNLAPGEAKGQLYDLTADPAERRNLYNERPDIVARLTALLRRYRNSAHSRPL